MVTKTMWVTQSFLPRIYQQWKEKTRIMCIAGHIMASQNQLYFGSASETQKIYDCFYFFQLANKYGCQWVRQTTQILSSHRNISETGKLASFKLTSPLTTLYFDCQFRTMLIHTALPIRVSVRFSATEERK